MAIGDIGAFVTHRWLKRQAEVGPARRLQAVVNSRQV